MPRISFIELPTTDLPATQAFYAQAFSMQMTAFGPTDACTLTGNVDLGLQADARLQACKARARQIASLRPGSAYLDLMSENAITREPANYFDELHYTPAAADAVRISYK